MDRESGCVPKASSAQADTGRIHPAQIRPRRYAILGSCPNKSACDFQKTRHVLYPPVTPDKPNNRVSCSNSQFGSQLGCCGTLTKLGEVHAVRHDHHSLAAGPESIDENPCTTMGIHQCKRRSSEHTFVNKTPKQSVVNVAASKGRENGNPYAPNCMRSSCIRRPEDAQREPK